jgi:hypothetical protein
MHNEDHSVRPPIVNDDLVGKVSNKTLENQQFTISELRTCFPQISSTILCEIVAERLHYHKVCACWVPKMLMDEQRNQRMSSAFTFLQRYHSEGEKFLDHIVTVDGN